MTLQDLLKLALHHIKIVIAIVVICTLVGIGVRVVKTGGGDSEYTAVAKLTISEPTATISASELMPLARAVAANVISDINKESVIVSQEYDLALRTITFTAITSAEDESFEIVNSVAQRTADETADLLREMADQYRSEIPVGELTGKSEPNGTITFGPSGRERAAALDTVSFTVSDAPQADRDSCIASAAKYALVGFFGGIFVALCVLLIINFVKKPLKDRSEVERELDLPVLAEGRALDIGNRLWANIQFAADEVPQTICILSIHQPVGRSVETALAEAVSDVGPDGGVMVTAYPPLAESIEGAYAARDADATVVCAVLWDDSLRDANYTMCELNLAQAKVAGVVLVDMERS